MSAPSAVHAIVPLALLEAIRNLDTPIDDGLADPISETGSKRLGTTSTVAAQIERYREAATGNGWVPADEALQVFRLVGRRPDADLVYSDAGRRAARLAVRTRWKARRLVRWLPLALGRTLGERAAVRIAAEVFSLRILSGSEGPGLRLTESLATGTGCAGAGCYFFSALMGELLRLTQGFEGAVVHDACVGRGGDCCSWRAAPAEPF